MANPAINRSGKLDPVMLPRALTGTIQLLKLSRQNQQDVTKTRVDVVPMGTNLVGQTQYAYTIQKPNDITSPFSAKNDAARGYLAKALAMGLYIKK